MLYGIETPHIEIEKNHSVSIEGVKCILEYDDSSVKIECDGIELKIIGDEIEINSMLNDRIEICGKIISLEFL